MAGEFLRVGVLKAVQSNRIDGGQRTLEPLGAREFLRLQPQLHILQHGQPGKECEGLEDDREARIGAMLGRTLEEHLPRRRT